MVFLRYFYIVALVLWLGGTVVAGGVVAPSVFGVLEGWHPVDGRMLAGRVFGAVLQRLYWLAYAMGGVMFVTLTLHRLVGARPIKYGIRTSILAFMLAMTLSADWYVGPKIAAIQTQASGRVSALPAGDPIRAEFNRLHGLANILLSLSVIGGLALLFWEARE